MALGATQEMLDEARAAYIRLASGSAVASFKDQNGETVTYSRANLAALWNLIGQLETELGVVKNALGPMRFWL